MASRTLRRKIWINLSLTALVGALVVLVVLEPEPEAPPPKPPLTELAPAAIARVVIEQPDRPTVRLERSEGEWRMTEPRELRASAGKIEELLAVAQAESQRRYPAAELDPAETGLAEPRAALMLDGTRLAFGDTDPIEGRRYVRLGETVHLIGGRYLARIRNEPLYWADNRLLPEGAEVTRLELPDVTLTRDTKGLWHADPEPEGLSADAPVALVEAWRNARALAVREAPAELPADAEAIRVGLKARDDPIVFHLVDNRTGFELIRQDRGLSYTMTGPQRAELLELRGGESREPAAGPPEEG